MLLYIIIIAAITFIIISKMPKNKMIECKTCGSKIASTANSCPVCGAKTTNKIVGEVIGGTALGIVLVPIIIVLIVVSVVFWSISTSKTNTTDNEYFYTEPEQTQISEALITLEEFERLQQGMTYDTCVSIIRGHGKQASEISIGDITTTSFVWEGYGSIGASATLSFQNGYLYSKVQFGLQ